MRRLQIMLIAVLCVVSAVFAGAKFMQMRSESDIPPEIQCSKEILDISVKQDESVLLSGMSASDPQDGDLTDRIMVAGLSKLISEDSAKITYLVFDSDGNMASYVRTVRYLDYRMPEIEVIDALNFSRDETLGIISNLRVEDAIDGDISDQIRISTLRSTSDSNVFSIVAQVTNSMGDTAKVELPVIIMETNPARPVIYLQEYLTYLEQGSTFDSNRYIRGILVNRKGVPAREAVVETNLDTSVPGTYWVYYSYSANGMTGMAIQTVVVKPMGGAQNES